MPDTPTVAQLAMLLAAIAVFIAGGAVSLARLRFERQPTGRRTQVARVAAKALLYLGILLCIGLLVWHSRLRGSWLPLEDNFGAFLWLAVLLALFVAYTQRAHPLRGLDWFVMPIVLLLLILAAVFGKTMPHEYRDSTLLLVHRVTAYGGFVAFAVAGAAGGMYLLANRRLRNKRLASGPGFGSLERLERLTLVSVTLGFPLLTIGLITGLVRVLDSHAPNTMGPDWYRNPKVLLACIAWVVYALVLHSPINPAFRGKRTALLSVLGFAIMIGTFVAAQFVGK
ncbi:MAG TPA: cytochrome c biogenesis protein CcsA [Tepidisphaeraceae bacterium]|nr:cytochrome c biogenesis protein CcsA [Tepidisphaeraceae bacterium]